MKINLDDPKLTAYALDELPEPERSVVAKAVAESPEAQAQVAETQRFARLVRAGFLSELNDGDAKQLNIMPLPEERARWPETRWSSLALAAALAVAAIIGAVVISGIRTKTHGPTAERLGRPPLQMEFEVAPDADKDAAQVTEQPAESAFVSVASNPVSTFPLRIGTASYAKVAHQLKSGKRPLRETVRIEEMINRFAYDYPDPQGEQALSVSIDAATCPWTEGHSLVRVGIKARQGSAGEIVAREAAIQVRFNPARVAAYRLIGFERVARGPAERSAANEQSAGVDMLAADTKTALYEIVATAHHTGGGEISTDLYATATLSYAPAGGESSTAAESSLTEIGTDFSQAPADFRFAAAVAQFGMLLRASPQPDGARLARVAEWASAARGDAAAERAEFVELVRRAQAIAL